MIFKLWCALPWVDGPTGNWSLTRTLAIVALACWCHVAEHSHEFTTAAVFVLALIVIAALSKNVGDFSSGVRSVGTWFRRRSSDRGVPAAVDGHD